MQTAEEFFQGFDEAGFTVPASWTPSRAAIGAGATDATITTSIRYRELDDDIADGMITGSFPSMEYPASRLPGLIEGEDITITPPGQSPALFRVRLVPRRGLDGTVAKAFLKRVN